MRENSKSTNELIKITEFGSVRSTLKWTWRTRNTVGILLFLGTTVQYLDRAHLSVTIVHMVKRDVGSSSHHDDNETATIRSKSECHSLFHHMDSNNQSNITADSNSFFLNNVQDHPISTDDVSEQFNWSPIQQGVVLSSFFWGYVLTMLLGGFIADKARAKYVMGFGYFISSILTMLCPLAAKISIHLLASLRMLKGLVEGICAPAIYYTCTIWFPSSEQAAIVPIVYAGQNTAVILLFPLSALIIPNLGWEWNFYFSAILALIWCILWLTLYHDSPNTHPYISETEKHFITTNQRKCFQKEGEFELATPPYMKIMTSRAYLCILLCFIAQYFYVDLIQVGMPTFFKNILYINIESNLFYSAFPFVVATISTFTVGFLNSEMLRRNIFSIGVSRRMLNSIGFFGASACLVMLTQSGCDPSLTGAIVSLAMFFACFEPAGALLNCIDLSPNYSGTLFSIANMVGMVGSLSAPNVFGYFTNEDQSLWAWSKCYLIAAGMLATSNTLYVIFTDTSIQSWNYKKSFPSVFQ